MTWRERVLYGFFWSLAWILAKTLWKTRISGQEIIPRTGPAILAPTHRSVVDIAIVGIMTRRQIHPLGKVEIFETWFGPFARALGAYPVRRGDADREAMAKVGEWLDADKIVLMFPEGTRQSGREIQKLFDGVAYAASKHGAPIIPIAIAGSEDALPKGKKMLRPARVIAKVGQPIIANPDQRSLRSQSKELSETLYTELQSLFDQANLERDSL